MNNVRAPKELLQAQRLANLTDSRIRIPYLGIELGLDFLIGLIPVVGDLIMVFVGLRIVNLGRKLGLPSHLRAVMYRHILIDFLLGLIPILGDVIDLFYKSNQKNVRIIEHWWVTENHHDIQKNSQQLLQKWENSL
ncbi:DUF4112 domain-containing protein [Paraglaciecola sp.]|uniref:DUF4112 domain-containing protein n=1 Tax=Paraglaciecola sp. TaxID=1920173 RepID=UPI003EF4FC4D